MAGPESGDRGPLRAIQGALGGGLRPGEVGAIYARAGVGKSSLLVHLALERLLREEPVLHVAVQGGVESVRDAYESIFTGLHHAQKPLERAEALLSVERHRVIHCTRGRVPLAAGIDTLLQSLAEAMEFAPRLVVMDGLEPSEDELLALRDLASRRGLAIWCGFTPTRPVNDVAFHVSLEMVPERAVVWLHVRKGRDSRPAGSGPGEIAELAPIRLESPTFVAREEDAPLPSPSTRVKASECTIYSGGAYGSEAAFGEAAEKWGVREVNFTFDGHVQARTRGAHPLTEQELAAGEVSLAYVSRRLRRGYGEGTMIRRVLQSLWHQVGAAQVVYVVGAIQEDGTVTGGTGWSVELARMWNKRLWVFDQEKDGWYRWNGEDWVEGTPIIDAAAICGTGTRYLSPVGKAAIEALFERSFSPKAP
ncbi:MAG: AAA family ATPase [Pseudomonadota bacterium]|nr:AAA family ATPase [Pseudomonadota bacterium]